MPSFRDRPFFALTCCAGLTLLTATGASQAQTPSLLEGRPAWKAGVARCDVTPQEPMWMAGYGGRDHPAEGTLHSIWVKALALQDAEGHRGVLVTSDLLGFAKPMSDRIRDRLMEAFQLSRADIVLNASHTHTGPVVQDSLYNIYPLTPAEIEKIDRYSQKLEGQIVELVGKALNNLAPARVFSANGVVRFAVNRRNNAEAQILDTHDLKGPVDHSAPVLKVAREDGSLLAVVFGYACHATTLSFYQWSGDYPGFAQIEIENAHPGVTAMFFAGCGADQNPLPRRTVALAQQYGRELASAVECVLADPMKSLDPALKTEYTEIELALTPAPTREQLAALAETGSAFQKRAAGRFLQTLDQGKSLRSSYPYPIQVWRIGAQPLVILGGEVVVDYALFLKQMLGPDLFVMAFSNDLMSYIPSLRVLREGGYEGETSQMEYEMPGKWAEDIESRLLTGVRDLASKAGLSPAPMPAP